MTHQESQNIAYTIKKCNDLTEVANQIAKEYGQQKMYIH